MITTLVVLFATSFTIGDFFDPSKIDYCKLKCNNGQVSSGCPDRRCYRHEGKGEISENLKEFRQLVLDTHNHLRNEFAKGNDSHNITYPLAANMHVVNYDLELEHLARCYIYGEVVTGNDKCAMTSYCKNKYGAGQNLYGDSFQDTTFMSVEDGMAVWYSEINKIPENERENLVKNFSSVRKYDADRFTQLIWGSVTRIGCVRIWYRRSLNISSKYIFGCNYAATDDECPGNVIGKPMYLIGKPCSQCGNEQCNYETGGTYDALCGGLKPVPTDETTIFYIKSRDYNSEGSTNMSIGFFTLLLCVFATSRNMIKI